MRLSGASVVLLLFTLVAAESDLETQSKPHQEAAPLYDTTMEEAFLDPKWINDNHVNDIGSGMKMHTLEKGDARNFPQRGDTVTVEFQGFLHNEEGKRYEVHRHFSKPFTFVIGLGNVIKGWDEAIKTMSLEAAFPDPCSVSDGLRPIPLRQRSCRSTL